MTALRDETDQVVEAGIVERAVEFIVRNTGATASLDEGSRRRDRPTYPVGALRETIVNALVHRDYLLGGTDIEISLFDDRLEVVSPGDLPNGNTVTRIRTGCRSSRNELLRDVMSDYGYVENVGLGVPRKIVKGMCEHNDTDVDLIEAEERFTVRLWAGAERGFQAD